MSTTAPKRIFPKALSPPVDFKRTLEASGLTVKEFAMKYGVSYPTMRSWLSGRRRPVGLSSLFLKFLERYPDEVEELIKEIGESNE